MYKLGLNHHTLVQGMRVKMYKMRSLALDHGKNTFVDLHLEFEAGRAFVIWDSLAVGEYELKARLEIDPGLLQKASGRSCDFFYRGELVLPQPENN
jgi:hypothetical protein